MSEPVLAAAHPATFREVMASREYRAVFVASAMSWFGDNAARAAITAYVFQQTNSIGASAATFAISYLPWLGIGSILSTVAERHSYRQVMIICDLLRMVLMALVALPGLPVSGMMALLFATSLLNPPFDAARSALMPRILDGDRYVVGLAMQKTSGQTARILGYICGASLAAYDARLALLFNAATFGISAFIVGLGVHERPPAMPVEQRTTLMRETVEGFQVVFRSPVLRAIALLVFGAAFFSVVPEGLAAGWAAHLTESPSDRGWYQGVIMMSNSVGFVIGGLLVNRLVSPNNRLRMIRPFGVLIPLFLVPAFFDFGLYPVAIMNALSGFALAGLLPASNGLFVQALPDAYRARAFGVMQSGLQVIQGIAVFAAGALASWISLPVVVGAWSGVGVIGMVLLSSTWPAPETITEEINGARSLNQAPAVPGDGRPAGRPDGTRLPEIPASQLPGGGAVPPATTIGWGAGLDGRESPLAGLPPPRAPGAHRLDPRNPRTMSARPHPERPPTGSHRRFDGGWPGTMGG